jgi:hypothetical protein
MARELMPKSSDAEEESSHDADSDHVSGGGAFQGAIDAFGAFYAGITGVAIGGLEALADRRAETRAAKLRQRGVPARPQRLRERARRISQS